jgi:hypothetical protein
MGKAEAGVCVLTNRLSLRLRCGLISKSCVFSSQYLYMGSRNKSEKVGGGTRTSILYQSLRLYQRPTTGIYQYDSLLHQGDRLPIQYMVCALVQRAM